jgi:hypothetical protein
LSGGEFRGEVGNTRRHAAYPLLNVRAATHPVHAYAVHPYPETLMKYTKALLMSALVAMSGAAFAQAGGGNGNGGGGGTGGSGNAHGAATSAPTTNGQPASGAMSSSGSKSHHMSKSKMKKPKTDTTNMPGADASSDTKGQ